MTIMMGLDQHRAQITAEWIDTETGEVSRSRISPAHRAGVRRFCERFRGQELEVGLEATTGWRFVAEELRRVGAVVHLAEPAETAARRGNKKRAKSDRADARHVRELLMIGRLPESWIPPDHILDLRSRVRLRHTLSHQRGEWQQGDLVSPWLPATAQPDDRRRAGLARRAAAARRSTRPDHRRAEDDRRARRSARTARSGAARICPPPAGLQGSDGTVRCRGADCGHDPRRTG
jgi:hypothetical protein